MRAGKGAIRLRHDLIASRGGWLRGMTELPVSKPEAATNGRPDKFFAKAAVFGVLGVESGGDERSAVHLGQIPAHREVGFTHPHLSHSRTVAKTRSSPVPELPDRDSPEDLAKTHASRASVENRRAAKTPPHGSLQPMELA